MRLGQLARKLEVRPTEIIEYLATQNILIENGTNTRIEDEHVAIAVQHFSPGLTIDDTADDHSDSATETGPLTSSDLPSSENEQLAGPGTPVEKIEVIKAPKIELSGLKVVGKIDLPEVKKKEAQTPERSAEERPKNQREEKRTKTRRNQSSKNPIALKRELEAMEERKRREEERRLQKERKTENYLRRVKTAQPTKAARIFKEETQQMTATELKAEPKSLWGKFIRWLTT